MKTFSCLKIYFITELLPILSVGVIIKIQKGKSYDEAGVELRELLLSKNNNGNASRESNENFPLKKFR